MRDWILELIVSRDERLLGMGLDRLRGIAKLSIAALVKLAFAASLVQHRRKLPKAVHHLASILIAQNEDCGECLQMASDLARRDGVPARYIQSAIQGNFSDLPVELEDVCMFASGVARGMECETYRRRLRSRYGEDGMTELALAISTARVFPTLRRAMGATQPSELALAA